MLNQNMAPRSSEVDRYISSAPKSIQAKLAQVREAIFEAAPGARESISYKIPFYDYRGRLAWFGLFTNHIGLFIRPPVLQEHRDELKGYSMTKSSLHLPLGKPIPVKLVKKLVKAGVRMNEERMGSA